MTTPVPAQPPGASMAPAPTELWRTRVDLSLPTGGSQRRRVPGWVLALAVATAVMSVVSFTTVLLWPSSGGGDGPATDPLAFHALEVAHRIDFDQTSQTAFARLDGDLVYVGWEQNSDLELVAVELATGQHRWRERIVGSPRWSSVFPVPGGVIVVGAGSDGAEQMYAHSADDGRALWRHGVSGDDWALVTAGNLVWFHAPAERLRGIDVGTGVDDWSIPMSRDAVTSWVIAERDLSGPTNASGSLGVSSTDSRLVMIDGETTSIIDGRNGGVLSQAENVVSGRDELLGYDGRLYVAANESGFQLLSYDLDNLSAQPRIHYRAGNDHYPERIEPCGQGRVCLLETENFGRETTELVVVDVAEGAAGERWRMPTPDARSVVVVGPWLLAVGRDGPVVGFDDSGQQVLRRDGVVGRINAGNLLVFSDSLADHARDLSAAGVAVEGERPVELGLLSGVFGSRCSWETALLACPDRAGATIWRIADD